MHHLRRAALCLSLMLPLACTSTAYSPASPDASATAEQVAALVLEDERVQWVKVTLTKPGAVPNAAGVGVEILRHRTPAASAN